MPKFFKIIAFIILLFIRASICFAVEDGFGSAGLVKSEHFSVYYSPTVDASSLVRQLNISPSDELLAGKSIRRRGSAEEEFADMVDILFMRACDILDMNLYSFQGEIKICRDTSQLEQVYNNLFDKDLKGRYSFYVYSLNTIYISAENFKREVLGHEIAHAVISHYFVVLPSVKVQEVLATYVEYQLRKAK
jgi:hypothetical protein